MLGHGIERVDPSRVAHGLRKAERGVTKACANIQNVIAGLRLDPNTVSVKVVLVEQEMSGDVSWPALENENVVVDGYGEDRQAAIQAAVRGVLDAPLLNSTSIAAENGCIERQTDVCVSQETV
jgi:hypothetical protein